MPTSYPMFSSGFRPRFPYSLNRWYSEGALAPVPALARSFVSVSSIR